MNTMQHNTNDFSLVDDQLLPFQCDAKGNLKTTPSMGGGGHTSLQTAFTGTNWTAFASQACRQLWHRRAC
jgi:hypothetical protein